MIRRPPRSTLFPYTTPLPISYPFHSLQATSQALQPMHRVESVRDRKSTRLNSSHTVISYAVFCLKKKKPITTHNASKQIGNDQDRCIRLKSHKTPYSPLHSLR